MKISEEEIRHICNLANLKIEDEKIENYKANLEDILNFVNILDTVDTKNVEETIGTQNKTNVFRKDEIKEFEDMEALLENAPDKENNMFKIPKVIN